MRLSLDLYRRQPRIGVTFTISFLLGVTISLCYLQFCGVLHDFYNTRFVSKLELHSNLYKTWLINNGASHVKTHMSHAGKQVIIYIICNE